MSKQSRLSGRVTMTNSPSAVRGHGSGGRSQESSTPFWSGSRSERSRFAALRCTWPSLKGRQRCPFLDEADQRRIGLRVSFELLDGLLEGEAEARHNAVPATPG
jgi:hypothetical protein